MAASDPAQIAAALVGGSLLSIPYRFAWWLSDGFATVSLDAPGVAQFDFPCNGPDLYYNYADGHYQAKHNAAIAKRITTHPNKTACMAKSHSESSPSTLIDASANPQRC